MVGSLRLATVIGNPGTPADEADVNDHVLDHRRARWRRRSPTTPASCRHGPSCASPTGRNGATGNDSATVSDTPYAFTVPCTATGGTANIGSTCSLTTTADALMPGTVRETKRTIWQLGEIVVLDGGADGDADTAADNTVFLRQGMFVPRRPDGRFRPGEIPHHVRSPLQDGY